MNSIDLSLGNIEKASAVIDPVFLNSPQFIDEQLCAALGHRTIIKVETANPIRSFKGRGADFFFQGLDRRLKVVCASAGNFGQAIAYAGRSRGMAVEVLVAADANPMKIARMQSLGATVTVGGADFDAASSLRSDELWNLGGYSWRTATNPRSAKEPARLPWSCCAWARSTASSFRSATEP